jgi:hypothetical protein
MTPSALLAIVEDEEKELRDIGWDGVSFVIHGMALYSRTADWLNVALLWGRHDHNSHHHPQHHHDNVQPKAEPYHVAQLRDGDAEYSLSLADVSIVGTPHTYPRIECRHPGSKDYRQVLPDLRQVARGAPLQVAKPDAHGPFQSVVRLRNAWMIVAGPMDASFNDTMFEFRPPGSSGLQPTFVTDIVKVRVQRPEAMGLPERVRLSSGRAFAIHNDFNGKKDTLSPDDPLLKHSALYQAALNPPPSKPSYLALATAAGGQGTDQLPVRNWTDPICEQERFGDLL